MSGPPHLMRGWHLQTSPSTLPPSPSALSHPTLPFQQNKSDEILKEKKYLPRVPWRFWVGWWMGGTKPDKPHIFWRGKLFSFWTISQSWPDSSTLSHWSKAKTAPYTHTVRPARGVKTFFHPCGFFCLGSIPSSFSGHKRSALLSRVVWARPREQTIGGD